ncbi:hypothetical protein FRC15_002680 [Serendipita sp. 397]|nr:hypothetical protein FRC15_002680 [Serendipita sp. 397]
MVSLGDLARYREQYNERQGRPKAGSEEVPFHRATKGNGHRNGKLVGGGGGGGEDLPRPRNYTRAMACYTQARMLHPDSGHAFHQIAILCSYQADYFGQILNYYRSLCVDHPFTTASDNLVHLLTKVLEASKTEQLQSSDPNASNANASNEEEAPGLVIERFKRDVVKLHGMWRVKRTTEAELAAHTEHTLSRFNKLLAERVLPIGLIVKVYVAALGAHRTISVLARKSTSTDGGKRNKAHAQKMEGLVLLHIMELHLCLVNLATEQLTLDAITTSTSDTPSGVGLPPPPLPPPAERITAVLRRVLQTLRVASKWLLGNQDYLYRAANPDKSPPPGLTRTLGEFWPAYARFATRLSTMFPKDDVRDIQKVTLDEDVELAGFAPLKKLLKAPEKLPVGIANQAHPNEEYLLRIRDVLKDLYALVKSQMNPLKYQNGVYTSKTESASKITIASSMLAQPEATLPLTIQSRTDVIAAPGVAGQLRASEDDEIASVSTEDPVTMAMRATLESSGNDDFPDEEMEDEEQILVQPGAFSRVDPLFESTPMLHGGRLSLSGPSVGPSRDPHAFNLSDLALHPEFNQPYVPQLPSPRYDAFGLTLTGSPVVNPNVLNPYPPLNHPIGSSALFYQDQQMPIPFARQPIGAISSPPRASQLLFSSPRHAPGPIGPPGPQDLLTSNHVLYSNANEHPISPVRVPHRLSVSANVNMNTPTLSGRPLEAQVPPTSSPPKTAQDLLMRVLGTANTSGLGPGPGPAGPGVIGSPTKGRLPRQSTSPPRGGNDRSEEGIPPLIFGTMNGQSIWAP